MPVYEAFKSRQFLIVKIFNLVIGFGSQQAAFFQFIKKGNFYVVKRYKLFA
jgi:hypothetical protein